MNSSEDPQVQHRDADGEDVTPLSLYPEASAEDEMPLPGDAKTIFLAGLFLLGLLAAVHAAAEIVWPFVLAFALALLLQPMQRLLERAHLPRALSSVLLVLAVLAVVIGLVTAISGPAVAWAAKLPDAVPRLIERLRVLAGPLDAVQTF